MRRRKLFGILTVIGTLAVIGVAAYRAFVPDSPFSEKYRVLAPLPWRQESQDAVRILGDRYVWIDNRTIVYFPFEGNKKLCAIKQRVGAGETYRAESLSNIRTDPYLLYFAASPNGKMLYTSDYDRQENRIYRVYALDGSGRTLPDQPISEELFWLSEGNCLAAYDNAEGTISRRSFDHTSLKPLSFSQPSQLYHAVAPDGTYFASDLQDPPHRSVLLERRSIYSGSSQKWTLLVPDAIENRYLCSVSPQGDRLLWFESTREQGWWSAYWAKLTHRTVEPREIFRYFVSDTKGSNPQTIVTTDKSVDPKWLPDGKHLSMVYNGALYVVPIP